MIVSSRTGSRETPRFRMAALLTAGLLIAGCGGDGDPTGPDGDTSPPNEAPSVTISSPSDGSTFQEGEDVSFLGSADDAEDGQLSGDALVWESDLDGEIGNGESFTRNDLTPGEHAITLTATDSEGASDSDELGIFLQRGDEPTSSISAPGEQSLFDEGESITFEGSADDAEDGQLSGSSLGWSSDVDGDLGDGESVTASSLSGGPHIVTLTATDSDGNTGTDDVSILVESPGFDIQVRFVDDFTEDQRQTVLEAMAPWEAAVTGDLSPVFLPDSLSDACLAEVRKGIDDLHVAVKDSAIDDPGNTLAQAGPRVARTDAGGNPTTPICGIVTIDEADLENSRLREIIVHEVGHVLGIGIPPLVGWGSNADVSDSRDPFFTGTSAEEAFRADLDGEAYLSDGVPLENTGGQGTAGAHWREENFDTELMTGFINPGVDNPLSVVSLASLVDLGYVVDLSTAEAYSLPMPQEALWEVEADATLSRPASSDQNFGVPDGDSALSERIVVGSNNDNDWSSDPESEAFTGLLRLGVVSPPAGVSIDSVTLELVVDMTNTETTGHDVELLRVTEGWQEDQVTWDSRPSFASSALLTFPFDSAAPSLYSSALLDLVRNWADGSVSNDGLALDAPDAPGDSTFSVGYLSRHDPGALLRPRMVVQGVTSSAGLQLRAAREPLDGGVDRGDLIDLGDDILPGPLYGVAPDGRVVRVVEIR